MKRLMITLMCLLLFTAATAMPAAACAGHRHHARSARTVQSARYANSRRAYYDYNTHRRSFWQKHRDKLTVAAGTGGGALLGGIIGGRKGAAIGALSGAGGSALYTYKIRNRSHRRY